MEKAMHELSVLTEVVRVVDELADKQNIDKVQSIVLQIGELSGVVPMFLTEYFPVITDEKPRYAGTELKVETLPGIAKCKDCGTNFNVIKYEGYCPKCKSFDKELLCGDEFLIKEITVPE